MVVRERYKEAANALSLNELAPRKHVPWLVLAAHLSLSLLLQHQDSLPKRFAKFIKKPALRYVYETPEAFPNPLESVSTMLLLRLGRTLRATRSISADHIRSEYSANQRCPHSCVLSSFQRCCERPGFVACALHRNFCVYSLALIQVFVLPDVKGGAIHLPTYLLDVPTYLLPSNLE